MKGLNSKSTIGIVGLGYVGFPLAKAFLSSGINVIGFDIDESKTKMISRGVSPLSKLVDKNIKGAIQKKTFFVTSRFNEVKKCDSIIICVPTPLNNYHQPDLSYVQGSLKSIIKHISRDTLICLESTTYPGTSREIVKPLIEAEGYKVGKDIFLGYSPEREDPGNKLYSIENTPKVISGYSKKCLNMVKSVYSLICENVVPVSSLEAAELCKLIENIQMSVNIGLMNELRLFAEQADINLFEVIDAASTKPFGFTPYYPGPGVGGHCIPIDPFYLTFKAKEYGVHTRFIELAGEVNESMPDYVIRRVSQELNNIKKCFSNSKILCVGLSYKKNIGDCRESPSMDIFNKLIKNGSTVDYHDPHVPVFPKMRKYNFKAKSIDLTKSKLSSYDIVLVNTLHDNIDVEFLYDNSELIVDSSGSIRTHIEDSHNKVVVI